VRLKDSWPPRAFCTTNPDAQCIGKHTLSTYPKELALTLGYSERDAKEFTGHIWRRIAATLAAENGATTHELQALGGWQSARTVDRYIQDSDRRRNRSSQLVSITPAAAPAAPAPESSQVLSPAVIHGNEENQPRFMNCVFHIQSQRAAESILGARLHSTMLDAPVEAFDNIDSIDREIVESFI
jgi:hypothetical protein